MKVTNTDEHQNKLSDAEKKERKRRRVLLADSDQTDGGIGIPGHALHGSAHIQSLQAARRTDLPETHRTVIRA